MIEGNDKARTSRRDQLLAAIGEAAFPAPPGIDAETGAATWEPADAAAIERVLGLFGIGSLDAATADADTVVNTVCTLAMEVGAHVQQLASGDPLDRKRWHPDYAAYVDALWRGDADAVAACARRLRIEGGIPNGSPTLDDGPLAAD